MLARRPCALSEEERACQADDALRARNAGRFEALLDGAAPAWMRDTFAWGAASTAWPEGVRAAFARAEGGRAAPHLVWQVPGGDLPTLRALVDCVVPADRGRAMAWATMNGVCSGAFATVRHFLDAGVDPNWQEPTVAGGGYFLLNATDLVLRLLLDRGANPSGPAGPGPRMEPIAAAAGCLDDLRLLLARGATVTSVAADDALFGSIRTRRADAARLLEAYGYRLGSAADNPAVVLRTALWRAIDCEADDCVCWLAERGGDLAAVPVYGDVRARILSSAELYPRTAALLRPAATSEGNPPPGSP